MIPLGSRVKDKITEFAGVADARCEFLNGCVQYRVQSKISKDGKVPEPQWIDETQLEIIGKSAIKKIKSDNGGGFRTYPSS